MKKTFLFLGVLALLIVVACCNPAKAEDDDLLKPEAAYLLLDSGNTDHKTNKIDLQFYSPYSAWKADNDFNRYHYLWRAVKHFEKLNPTCTFGAIQPQVDEEADRFIINIWCVEHKEKSKI